jgi:ribosomal protein L29
MAPTRLQLLFMLLHSAASLVATRPARTCVVLRAQVGSSSRSRAFTKTGPRKPQSPRPEQYPDVQKLDDLAIKKRNIKYDPEYADDISRAKRRLFDLRMRKSQRLPFKSSEFRELRKFVAQLKTQQREDELRASGVDLRKKKPQTRRERQKMAEKRARQLATKARNRERYGLEELAVAEDAPSA